MKKSLSDIASTKQIILGLIGVVVLVVALAIIFTSANDSTDVQVNTTDPPREPIPVENVLYSTDYIKNYGSHLSNCLTIVDEYVYSIGWYVDRQDELSLLDACGQDGTELVKQLDFYDQLPNGDLPQGFNLLGVVEYSEEEASL